MSLIMVNNTHTSDSDMEFLQKLHISLTENDVTRTLQTIERIMDNEIDNYENGSTTINQPLLTLAAQVHGEITRKYNLPNTYFQSAYEVELFHPIINMGNHLKLQALLLSNQYNIDKFLVSGNFNVLENCIMAFDKAICDNKSNILLLLLKFINIICRKCYCAREIANLFKLHHLHFCLQHSHNLIKNETLLLLMQTEFKEEKALNIFFHIMTFWPWINKNKFYILKAISSKYSLTKFLSLINQSEASFLAGIRLAILYRDLIIPSQSLIKVLIDRNYSSIFNLIADILMNGSKMEIQNLCLYWFPHIRVNYTERIFERLSIKKESYIGNLIKSMPTENINVFRLSVLLNLFPKQIALAYKTDYVHIKDELISKYLFWDIETQIFIYKFVVDNMEQILPLEKYLEFIYTYILEHKCTENARLRSTILSKIPNIINYAERMLKKFSNNNHSSNDMKAKLLKTSSKLCIQTFFSRLRMFIENEMFSNLYQPKILALKILEILLKSLYGFKETFRKSDKHDKHHILDNQKLADYLKQEKIISCESLSRHLFALIKDPAYYEDAHELALNLLHFVPHPDISNTELVEICRECCLHENVDECNLSATYAEIFIRNCEHNSLDMDIIEFYNNTLHSLNNKIIDFSDDPLLACKMKGGHLFGYINVLSKIVELRPALMQYQDHYIQLLTIIEAIINKILDMLNITNVSGINGCASFHDMEQSLIILIKKSSYYKVYKKENEDLQKFLLLSLWFTLKACCELSTVLANSVIKIDSGTTINVELYLQRCVLINKSVLMRCRHKGAIEYAGYCIGMLTKMITTKLSENTIIYEFMQQLLLQLYNLEIKDISRTRRGAGFSLMLLHLLKNEHYRTKPLLRSTLNALIQILSCNVLSNGMVETIDANKNYDNIETLILHYLCVLVRDTELKDVMNSYYNEVMKYTIIYINSQDWATCNAALQLFGALLTKIIGQSNSNCQSSNNFWSNSNQTEPHSKIIVACWKNNGWLTFAEVLYKYPIICELALSNTNKNKEKYFHGEIRSTIVFLEFFQNVSFYYMEDAIPKETEFLKQFRQLTWSLLRHPYAKIRKLASICFLNAHEFKCELPILLLKITEILFTVKNENFFDGLLLTIYGGICKIIFETQCMDDNIAEYFLIKLKQNFKVQMKFILSQITHTPYCLCKLFHILLLLNLETEQVIIEELKQLNVLKGSFGIDEWLKCVSTFKQ